MWLKLDAPDLRRQFRATFHGTDEEVMLAEALFSALAQQQPALHAVTGMGRLSLAGGPYQEAKRRWSIGVAFPDGEYGISLGVPGYSQPVAEHRGPLGPTCVRIAAWVGALSDGAWPEPGREPASDTDPEQPAYPKGTRVRVLPKGGRNTERVGRVAETHWHFEFGRWTYYLAVDGRSLKKRYFAADLSTA